LAAFNRAFTCPAICSNSLSRASFIFLALFFHQRRPAQPVQLPADFAVYRFRGVMIFSGDGPADFNDHGVSKDGMLCWRTARKDGHHLFRVSFAKPFFIRTLDSVVTGIRHPGSPQPLFGCLEFPPGLVHPGSKLCRIVLGSVRAGGPELPFFPLDFLQTPVVRAPCLLRFDLPMQRVLPFPKTLAGHLQDPDPGIGFLPTITDPGSCTLASAKKHEAPNNQRPYSDIKRFHTRAALNEWFIRFGPWIRPPQAAGGKSSGPACLRLSHNGEVRRLILPDKKFFYK
jgi:hypothetical protein